MENYEVTIEKLVYGGFGLARKDGKVIFVTNSIPNEIHLVSDYLNKKDFSYARSVRIIKSSDKRVVPPCIYSENCGGCDWLFLDYQSQLQFKKGILLELLLKIGNIYNLPEIDIIPSPQFFYRNRVQLKTSDSGIGFCKRGSNQIVDISQCISASKSINSKLSEIRGIRGVQLSPGEDITIFTNSNGDTITNYNYNDKNLENRDFIFQNIGEFRFRASIKSFFQVNIFQLDNFINIITKNAPDVEKFADLYSGSGFFSIPLSKKFKAGIGVEISKESYFDGIENLKLNNVKNLKFYNTDVSTSFPILKKFAPELILLDPPRGGLNKNFIDKLLLLENLKNIIYISCDPSTLSRDLKKISLKFKIYKIFFIDMFPNSFHIESIIFLEKI